MKEGFCKFVSFGFVVLACRVASARRTLERLLEGLLVGRYGSTFCVEICVAIVSFRQIVTISKSLSLRVVLETGVDEVIRSPKAHAQLTSYDDRNGGPRRVELSRHG